MPGPVPGPLRGPGHPKEKVGTTLFTPLLPISTLTFSELVTLHPLLSEERRTGDQVPVTVRSLRERAQKRGDGQAGNEGKRRLFQLLRPCRSFSQVLQGFPQLYRWKDAQISKKRLGIRTNMACGPLGSVGICGACWFLF